MSNLDQFAGAELAVAELEIVTGGRNGNGNGRGNRGGDRYVNNGQIGLINVNDATFGNGATISIRNVRF